MTAPLVECAGLVKIYKVPEAGVEVVALQGLELAVRAGEMLAVVGRSGSGKSTLLNILGGLDTPSAGRCRVAGQLLSRMNDRERDEYRRFVVGHVWQQSGRNLIPDLTLSENVGLPQLLARVGGHERRARATELLERVGLGARTSQRPDQLSGGEQQRGAIAVALANGPRLLLADEPTGELDSATAGEIVALLHALTRALDLTVILVTHDPAVAAAADRIVLIRDGRTSAETVRRAGPATGPTDAERDPPGGATSLVDRAGWVQLPEGALRAVDFAGRAEVWLVADHVELWPVGARELAEGNILAPSGLPASGQSEAVVIDQAGWFQLPDAALAWLAFTSGRATIRVAGDHVEMWPAGAQGE